MATFKDYYGILGLTNNASKKLIRNAYSKLSERYSPDKDHNRNKREQAEAAKKLEEIKEAFDVLSDDKKKKRHDEYYTKPDFRTRAEREKDDAEFNQEDAKGAAKLYRDAHREEFPDEEAEEEEVRKKILGKLKRALREKGIDDSDAIKRIEDEMYFASKGAGGRTKEDIIYEEAANRAGEVAIFEKTARDFLGEEGIKGIKKEDFEKIVEHLIVARNKGWIEEDDDVEDYLKEVMHSEDIAEDDDLKITEKIKKSIKLHFEDKDARADREKIDGIILETFRALENKVKLKDVKDEVVEQRRQGVEWEDVAEKSRDALAAKLEEKRIAEEERLEEERIAEEERLAAREEKKIQRVASTISRSLKDKYGAEYESDEIMEGIRNKINEGNSRAVASKAISKELEDQERDKVEDEAGEHNRKRDKWEDDARKEDKERTAVKEWLSEVLEGNTKKINKVLRELKNAGKDNNLEEAQKAIENKEIKLGMNLKKTFKDWSKVAGKGIGKGLLWGGVKAPWAMAKSGGRMAKWGGREFIKDWNPNIFVVLAAIMYFLDLGIFGLGTTFNGFNIDRFSWSMLSEWRKIFFNFVIAIIFVFYWLVYRPNLMEKISFAFLLIVTSGLVSFGALNFSLLHLVLGYIIFLGFIGPVIAAESGDKSKAHWIMAALLIFDYIGYGLLYKYGGGILPIDLTNRVIFPIWFYFTMLYAYRVKHNKFTTFVLISVILVNIFAVGYDTVFVTSLGDEDVAEQEEEAKNFLERAREGWKQLVERTTRGYQRQLEFATGGYYEGRVEDHENVPLGVYFEDVRTSVLDFYEDEPVEVWGDLLVMALDEEDPVTVNVGCLYPEESIPGKIISRNEFKIYTMEEEVIECRFDPRAIPSGTRKIRLTADFNFKTMSYLKSYMIDKETLRAFRRDGVNVLNHYGITDKNPTASFTNGPVKIGMETNKPPIGIDDSATPFLGITIESQWSGNIKDIKEIKDETDDKRKTDANLPKGKKFYDLVVYIPKGLKFFENCDEKFHLVTAGKMAEQYPDFNTYVLTERGKKYLIPKEDQLIGIKGINYRSLRCLMKVDDKNKILGDVPFITKYFRTTIRYDYELMQDVRVNIKPAPKIDYFVTGGTCNAGKEYGLIFEKINDSNLKDCWPYLDIFNWYHKQMPSGDNINLLMVLAIAQEATGCEPKDSGGIMQVEHNGTIVDYDDVEPTDYGLCEQFEAVKGKVCCKITDDTGISYQEEDEGDCSGEGKEKVIPQEGCSNMLKIKANQLGDYDYDKYGCDVIAQIKHGTNLLHVTSDSANKKTCDDRVGCGFDGLKLMKFALLGYGLGSEQVTAEAMEDHYRGIPIYTAMKNGCEQYFRGRTDDDGYDICTGTKGGKSDVRAYGAAYVNKVFDVYRAACRGIGGNEAYEKEETVT